jgi:hypothetical protein
MLRRSSAGIILLCLVIQFHFQALLGFGQDYVFLGKQTDFDGTISLTSNFGESVVTATNEHHNTTIEKIVEQQQARNEAISSAFFHFEYSYHHFFYDEAEKSPLFDPVANGMKVNISAAFKGLKQTVVQKVSVEESAPSFSYWFDGAESFVLKNGGATRLRGRLPDQFSEVKDYLRRQFLFVTPDDLASRKKEENYLPTLFTMANCEVRKCVELVDGHRCVVVVVEGAMFFWIGIEDGCVRRLFRVIEPSDPRPGTVFYLTEFLDVGDIGEGFVAPMRISTTQFGRPNMGENTGKPHISIVYEVHDFRINDRVLDADFSVELPEDTPVDDRVNEIFYITKSANVGIVEATSSAISALKQREQLSAPTAIVWGANLLLILFVCSRIYQAANVSKSSA